MRFLTWRLQLAIVAVFFLGGESLYAQNTDAASDKIVVVGNKSQPVQWNHERSLQGAILAAQPNGTVIIPSTYAGTDCSPLSSCNPGNVCVIDWRIGGTGSGNCNGGNGSGSLTVPVPIASGGTGSSAPGTITGSLCFFTPSAFFCDQNALSDGSGHLSASTINANAFTISGPGAGVITVAEGSGIALPNAGSDSYYVDSGTHLFTCLTNSGGNCLPSATGATVTGSPASGNLTKFSGAASLTSGDLSGDVSTAGTLVTVAAKINGNSVPSGVAADQLLVGTAANTFSFKTLPSCLDASGNHLNYDPSTHTVSCGTTGGAGGSGAGGGAGTSFTAQTAVTIAGTTHNIGSKNLLAQCYDNASPANAISPASYTVNGSTFDVVINFTSAQTGYCVVSGLGPAKYSTTFTSVTSKTVTGATHGLGRADLSVTLWDNATPRNQIEAASITVNASTFDVVATFTTAQSGTIVIQ